MTNNASVTSGYSSAQLKRAKAIEKIGKIAIYTILVVYAIIIILPFSIILITSFKNSYDASAVEWVWIPEDGFTAIGYVDVFTYTGSNTAVLPTLIQSFLNTLFYILPPTLIGLMTSSMAAYAITKLRFRAKNLIYGILLATMMIPGTITIAPQFSIYDTIGWVDTPLPLMIPGMFGAAACVFFMRQFFTGIPDSVIESAKLDGVGYVGIFFKIMVPLSVPALIAQGLLGFIGGYNDYFGPLIYLQSSELYNLQVALRVFSDAFGDEPNVVMAGTVSALVPTLIVYFVAQEYFIEGIAASGIKQ